MVWIVVGIVLLIALAAWWLHRRGSTGMEVRGSVDTEVGALGQNYGNFAGGRGGSSG